jgi:hypothetical protein
VTSFPARLRPFTARALDSVKVAIQSIWWAVMSKGKGLEGLLDGRYFDREIIVLCVRCVTVCVFGDDELRQR